MFALAAQSLAMILTHSNLTPNKHPGYNAIESLVTGVLALSMVFDKSLYILRVLIKGKYSMVLEVRYWPC